MNFTILFFFFILVLSLLSITTIDCWRRLVISKLQSREEIVSNRNEPTASLGLIDVTMVFLIWLTTQMLALYLIGDSPDSSVPLVQPDYRTETGMDVDRLSARLFLTRQMFLIGLAQIVATVIASGILLNRYLSAHMLGFLSTKWSDDIKIGIASFVIVIPPILVLQFFLTKLVPYKHPTLDSLKDNPYWPMIAAAWFTAVLVAPVCEEFFFRGVLQQWLKNVFPLGKTTLERAISGGLPEFFRREQERRGECATDSNKSSERFNGWAVFFSSGAFAAVHLGQGAAALPLFFLGLALGYIFEKTNSLLPCILLHMGLNGFSMFWFTMSLLFQEPEPFP